MNADCKGDKIGSYDTYGCDYYKKPLALNVKELAEDNDRLHKQLDLLKRELRRWRRYGTWVRETDDDNLLTCSECDYVWIVHEVPTGCEDEIPDYCPHCGSNMIDVKERGYDW